MPRHFVQTARRAGMGERVVEATFEALIEQIPAAFKAVESGFPADFPDGLVRSILAGVRARLQIMRRR